MFKPKPLKSVLLAIGFKLFYSLKAIARDTFKCFKALNGIAVGSLMTPGVTRGTAVLLFVVTIAASAGLLITKPTPVSAATSSYLNFQARLETSSGAIAPDGNYNVTFHLYNAATSTGATDTGCGTDANCVWEETRTGADQVRVANGYLTVNLGSVTAFGSSINWDQQLWLTMDIGGTSGSPVWDGEMSPRIQLTAVPYAFQANSATQLQATVASNTGTLKFDTTMTGGNQTFVLPDQGAAGSYNLLTTSKANSSYIQNGTSPQTASFNITGTGTTGGLTVTNAGNVAFQRGADYSATGTQADINFGTGAVVRLTGASALTIDSIANGADGRLLTIINASGVAATIRDQSTSTTSTAANKIITGTGANMTLAVDASISLVYDSGSNRWRVVGSAATTGSGTAFLQGGNSFTAQAVLGTNDNYSLALETNGTQRLVVDTSATTNFTFQQASNLLVGSATSGQQLTIQGGTATGAGNIGGTLLLQGGAGGSGAASGSVVVKSNGSNSTTAFAVQDYNGGQVLGVDTTNNAIVLGKDGTTSALTVRGGAVSSSSNTRGSNITFDASNGTGAAGSGDFIFRTAGGTGTVTKDATSVSGWGISSGTISWSHTVASQSNRILIVGLITDKNTTFTKVEWDPTGTDQLLTRLGSTVNCPATELPALGCHVDLWYVTAPTTGTHTIKATLSATNYASGGAVSYYNVDQSTPFGTSNTLTGFTTSNQTTSNLAITTTSNSQLVVGIIGSDNTTNNGNGTQLWKDSFIFTSMGASMAGTGGTVNLNWSVNTGDYGAIGVPLNAAANSTPDTLQERMRITATGNVGINTATPQYALDVSGTIQASTSVLTPLLDAATSGGTLSVGTTNATTLNIGNSTAATAVTIQGGTTATAVNIQSGSGGKINIGSSNVANTIQIGSTTLSSGTQTINIGTNNTSGGTTNITIGTGGTATGGTTTLQSKSYLTLATNGTTRATFDSASNALYLGNGLTAAAPNSFTIQGTGSTTTAVAGGAITIQGGNATVGSANGGNLTLAGGTGVGTGVSGLVILKTPTFSAASNDANCYTGGSLVSADCTITATSVNGSSSVVIGFSASGKSATLPDPTTLTTGRVIYIIAANGSSDFTLKANVGEGTGIEQDIAMRQNTTATMIWTGSNWTAAGASSSTTLQAAYDNTLTSAGGAELILSNTSNHNGLTIRDSLTSPVGTTGNGTLLEVQSAQAANLFSVNSNVTDYANNGGAESTLGAEWAAIGSGATVSQNTSSTYIANGIGSIKIQTTGTANSGAKNVLTSALTANLRYNVSFAARLDSSSSSTFTDLEVDYSQDGTSTTACSNYSTQTIPTSVWTKVTCTFTTPASGITSSNALFIRQTAGASRIWYVDNVSVTISADLSYATDGGVDDNTNFSTNWVNDGLGTVSVTRDTSTGYDASDSAKVDITAGAANAGLRNKLAINPLPSTLYRISVHVNATSTFNDFKVRYSRDGSTTSGGNYVDCVDYNTQTISTAANDFTQVTCYITTDSTAATSPYVYFVETSSATRTYYVDAFSMTLASNAVPNVQVGGGVYGGPVTLLTLDRAASAPIAANNEALLGSMYYDTTLGKLQCYEADGWGACGSSPDDIITISPEYTNAVLHGTGVGTMTSDFCSDYLDINDATHGTPVCGTNETYNFYKWTSPQPSAQTYSIYVTYQLPETFKSFASGSTSLMGRTDSTNSTVQYSIYRNTTSGLSPCGSTITVSTGSQTSWQTKVASGAADPSACGFSAGDSVVFKIDVIASQNADAYVGNIGFTFSNK